MTDGDLNRTLVAAHLSGLCHPTREYAVRGGSNSKAAVDDEARRSPEAQTARELGVVFNPLAVTLRYYTFTERLDVRHLGQYGEIVPGLLANRVLVFVEYVSIFGKAILIPGAFARKCRRHREGVTGQRKVAVCQRDAPGFRSLISVENDVSLRAPRTLEVTEFQYANGSSARSEKATGIMEGLPVRNTHPVQ